MKISGAIAAVLDDENSEYHIDKQELSEGDNLTEFAHAVGNLSPSIILTALSSQFGGDMLHHHALMTRILFQSLKSTE